ncbi:MAG: CvpA family protein [Opitutales bacterium]
MPTTFTTYQLDFSEFETNLLKILFFTLPAMILMWRGMHGWRLGLKRKIAALLSMMGGLAAAYWFGPRMASSLPKDFIEHPLADQVAGGLLAAVIAYCCLRLFFAAILRAGSNSSEYSRNKLAGGLLGLSEGLLLLFLLVLIVRWTSEVSEAYVLARSPEGVSPKAVLEKDTANLNFAARAALYWNHRLDEEPVGAWIDKTDPIPKDFYTISKNLVILTRNPRVLEEFAQTPEVVSFLKDSALHEIIQNPELTELYKRGEYLSILWREPVQELLKNEEFLRRLRDANIDRALARAVRRVHG